MSDQSLQLIRSKIYEIRNEPVMLDHDLAEIYQVETRVLKQAVRRNIDRFPDDFMFEITKLEYDSLRSQFVIINEKDETNARGKHSKYLPFAFTEQGVAMLSSVLHSDTAIKMNISIMRAFVAVRNLTPSNSRILELRYEMKQLKEYMEAVFSDYNDINEDTRVQLELINQTLAELQTANKLIASKPRRQIGFIPDNREEHTK